MSRAFHGAALVVHPPSILVGILEPFDRSGSIHDTDRITYRCFLPDLTRFMTVCCVASDQNGLSIPNIRTLGGDSAPHEADFGKRAPLAPHLAQPIRNHTPYYLFFKQKKIDLPQIQPSGFIIDISTSLT